MKIEIITRDKLFVQKIKEKFSQFESFENVLYVVARKEEEIRISSLMDDGIQIVFIDADYVKNPIELAKQIQKAHASIEIVFVASSVENAYTYYEVEHTGFILKTDCDKYLDIIGNRIIKHLDLFNARYIKVHWKSAVYVIPNNDILFIERDKRKTLIHTIQGDIYTTYQHIDEFVHDLDVGFLRIHFSYFVNASYVKEFHRNHLILINDVFVPISRKYAKEIKEYYG